MKYCKKCHEILSEDETRCACGTAAEECTVQTAVKVTSVKGSLRPIAESALKEKGIPYEFFNPEMDIYTQYNAKVNRETDFSLLVPFEFYSHAFDVCVGLGLAAEQDKKQIDPSTQAQDDKTYEQRFEQATGAKPGFFKVLWIVLFIIAACLLIWGIDLIAALIKSSMGIPVVAKLFNIII